MPFEIDPLEALVRDFEELVGRRNDRSQVSYYESKEVHVSALVAKTARQGFEEIISDMKLGEDDGGEFIEEDAPGWWSFKGDPMAWEMTKHSTKRELQLRLPLKSGWTLTGTLDALSIYGNRVVIEEMKANVFPSEGTHDEKSMRQAALYLAIFFALYRGGQRHFPASPDEYASAREKIERTLRQAGVSNQAASEKALELVPDGSLDFNAPEGLVPHGVHIRIASAFPDSRMAKSYLLGESALRDFLEFYVAKAEAIVEAVETGDPSVARHFDDQYRDEHIKPFAEVGDPPPPVKAMLWTAWENKEIQAKAKKALSANNADLYRSWAKGELQEMVYQLDAGLSCNVRAPSAKKNFIQLYFRGKPVKKDETPN